MIRENLVLLEYMVKKRLEEDDKRLEAIRGVNEILSKASFNLDGLVVENQASVLKELVAIKGKPLTYSEYELVEEIFTIEL